MWCWGRAHPHSSDAKAAATGDLGEGVVSQARGVLNESGIRG